MSKIFLSYPTLHAPDMRSITSVYQAVLTCADKHQVLLKYEVGDSLISRARNNHITEFLNDTDCEYFVSIDSDIEIVNVFQTNNIFCKLTEHDVDFVGGLYALKNDKVIQCSSQSIKQEDTWEFGSGLKEMKWLSSGCWCLKRSAVERMAKGYPELEYDGDGNRSKKTIHGLYTPYIHTLKKEDNPELEKDARKYLSEDWAFAQRWKDLDPENKIYADTSIVLKHWGVKAYSLWEVEAVVHKKPEATSEVPEAGFELDE